MKHYFLFSFLAGILMAFGLESLFGLWGLPLACVMGAWGVRSAIDMVRDDLRRYGTGADGNHGLTRMYTDKGNGER